jgi:cytoskeletal protein RodZ
MTAPEGQSVVISPGERLQNARERAGMSLADAAVRLRLPVDTLQALEAGSLQALGASIIVRGHLRRYASLVGIPEAEIFEAYDDTWSGRFVSPDLRGVVTDAAVRSEVRRVALRPRHALITAIVIVLLALVSWARHYSPKTAGLQFFGTVSPSAGPAP